MTTLQITERCKYSEGYLEQHEWRVARATELMLTGFSRARTRDLMRLKDDAIINAACEKARQEWLAVGVVPEQENYDTSTWMRRLTYLTGRLTQLLMERYDWKRCMRILEIDMAMFEYVLDRAVIRAQGEQREIEGQFAAFHPLGPEHLRFD